MYGSNTSVSYNDTYPSTRTADSNLVLLNSTAFLGPGWSANLNCSDTTNSYKYIHFFVYGNGSNYNWGYYRAYKGTYVTSNFLNGTNYYIDSDPTSGNPRFKNVNASTIQG